MKRRHSFLLLAAVVLVGVFPVLAADKVKLSTVAPVGDFTDVVKAKIDALQIVWPITTVISKPSRIDPSGRRRGRRVVPGNRRIRRRQSGEGDRGGCRDAAIELSKSRLIR